MEILGLINVPAWLILLLAVFLLIYVFGTRNFDTFKKMGVPGPKPYPVIGTMLPLFTKYSDIRKFDRDLVSKYGKILGVYEGNRPVFIVADTKFYKQILVKDFHIFTDRSQLLDVELFEEPLNKMLTVLTGEHWKHVRSLCTPTFTSGKLKRMIPTINKCAELLVENLTEIAKKGEDIDTKENFGNFSMDVIARTAFGLELNTQKEKDSPFIQMANKIMRPSSTVLTVMFLLPWLPTLLKKMFGYNMLEMNPSPNKFFSKFVKQALEERKSNKMERSDFLQLMMNAHVNKPTEEDMADEELSHSIKFGDGDAWTTKGLTENEIIAQAMVFLVAGFGTTSDTLCWLCYELALNPEIQDKLIEEVDEVIKGEALTNEMLNKLEYTEMCINESMRKYPAAFRTNREASEDVTIGDVTVPKGMRVDIAIDAVHYDPEIYPDPEKFIPERFTAEEKQARSPYHWLPFGYGPRNCIGMRLAVLEMKIAIASMAQKMKFVKCDNTEIPVKMQMLAPKNPIKLRAQLR